MEPKPPRSTELAWRLRSASARGALPGFHHRGARCDGEVWQYAADAWRESGVCLEAVRDPSFDSKRPCFDGFEARQKGSHGKGQNSIGSFLGTPLLEVHFSWLFGNQLWQGRGGRAGGSPQTEVCYMKAKRYHPLLRVLGSVFLWMGTELSGIWESFLEYSYSFKGGFEWLYSVLS